MPSGLGVHSASLPGCQRRARRPQPAAHERQGATDKAVPPPGAMLPPTNQKIARGSDLSMDRVRGQPAGSACSQGPAGSGGHALGGAASRVSPPPPLPFYQGRG